MYDEYHHCRLIRVVMDCFDRPLAELWLDR